MWDVLLARLEEPWPRLEEPWLNPDSAILDLPFLLPVGSNYKSLYIVVIGKSNPNSSSNSTNSDINLLILFWLSCCYYKETLNSNN